MASNPEGLIDVRADHITAQSARCPGGRVSTYTGALMTELNLVLVSRMLPRFRAGLKALKFKDNTVKYYCGCITFLMCPAVGLGWF